MAPAKITVTRDAEPMPAIERRQPRRFWSHALLGVACVILVNAVFGDKGLIEMRAARKAYAAAAQELARLRRENAVLRDRVRRLGSDPAAIESVARGELGLVKPGEILVTIKDVK